MSSASSDELGTTGLRSKRTATFRAAILPVGRPERRIRRDDCDSKLLPARRCSVLSRPDRQVTRRARTADYKLRTGTLDLPRFVHRVLWYGDLSPANKLEKQRPTAVD